MNASGQLTGLAALAAVAGFAQAGAIPPVAVLRVLLHAAALLRAAGAERPLRTNWMEGKELVSEGKRHRAGDRDLATQPGSSQLFNLRIIYTYLMKKVRTSIPKWQYRPYKPGSHRQAP